MDASTPPIIDIHNEIIAQLDGYYNNNQIPNIIFHGASGTGKKQIVIDFIDKIYNSNRKLIQSNVMFVNCSHGKGIKFIREDLKFFAKANLNNTGNMLFKTIILLNADYLTNDAQSALRRCIELFSYTTRFFMIVENKHKLLAPILSRFCEIYVPEHYKDGNLLNLHQYILDKIVDMRSIEKTQHQYMDNLIHHLLTDAAENKLTHKNIVEFCETIYINGFSCLDLVEGIKRSNNFTEITKINIHVYYLKIKSEIRCEKLLLFSILNYISKRDLEDIYKLKFI